MLSATRYLLKPSNITQTLMNRNLSSLVKNVSFYVGLKKINFELKFNFMNFTNKISPLILEL